MSWPPGGYEAPSTPFEMLVMEPGPAQGAQRSSQEFRSEGTDCVHALTRCEACGRFARDHR